MPEPLGGLVDALRISKTWMTSTHDPRDTELASGFTVRDYERARNSQDRNAISKAIRRRFTERYLDPVSCEKAPRHGFTMMAVSCLMIEALESFRQGWETSDRQSKAAFCFFFDNAQPFKDFRGHASSFYSHIQTSQENLAEIRGRGLGVGSWGLGTEPRGWGLVVYSAPEYSMAGRRGVVHPAGGMVQRRRRLSVEGLVTGWAANEREVEHRSLRLWHNR